MKTDYAETVKALNEVLDKLKEIQNTIVRACIGLTVLRRGLIE